MSVPVAGLRAAILMQCLKSVAGEAVSENSICVFVAGNGLGTFDRPVGRFDTESACAQAVRDRFPVAANGVVYDTSGSHWCWAVFSMNEVSRTSRYMNTSRTCFLGNATGDCDLHSPCYYRSMHDGNKCAVDPLVCGSGNFRCCADNCYCAPVIGLYLALVLPILLGPWVFRTLGVSHPSCSAPRSPLLNVMTPLGFILVIVRILPTVIKASDMDQHGIRYPFDGFLSAGRPWRSYLFIPLGTTMVLLSLLPSLGDVRSVLAIAVWWIAFGLVGTLIFIERAINEFPNDASHSGNALAINAAVAVAHLLIVLCTLPIVCRGSLWRPTRQIAAWRLRHLWGVYRTMMAVIGLWALVVIIIRAIAPETPGLNANHTKQEVNDHELAYLLCLFLQGALFSMLPSYSFRTRFSYLAVRRRGPRCVSSQDVTGRGAEKVHDLLLRFPQQGIDAHSPASSLVDWPEDPPGVGSRLVMRRARDGGPSPRLAETIATADDANGVVELGRGGFALVLSAQLDGTPLAVKVAKPTGKAVTAETVEAFRREALVMTRAGFRHAHLCACVGTCVVADYPAILLEFYEGGSLSQALGLRTSGGHSPLARPELVAFAERWRLAPQLASGVAHLHAQGILHCDLKASNVLLRPNERHAVGHAVLADFGMAAPMSARATLAGTTRYMAPEVSGQSQRAQCDPS